MLLLTMEACPPPTLGLRPRRDLPACVRTRPHTCSRGKTYGAILSGLTPREGPSGIVEYCVIGHTPTSPQPGLSVCSDAFGSEWFRSGGDRGRRRQCDGGSVAEDEVAVGGAIRRTKVPDRGDFNCSSSGPWAAGASWVGAGVWLSSGKRSSVRSNRDTYGCCFVCRGWGVARALK